MLVFISVFFFGIQSPQAKVKYTKALKKWSAQNEVYQRKDLFVSIRWRATYQSAAFVSAKIDKMASFYQYTGDKKDKFSVALTQKFRERSAFYVSFYTYDYKYSDISQAKNYWKLYLEVEGKRYEPLEYERINEIKPLYEVLYPYSDGWSRHYYVYFPKLDLDQKSFKLVVTGPPGKSELHWK